MEVPVRKPPQAPDADLGYKHYDFPEQQSDEWRVKAVVLPRVDGVYQTKGLRSPTSPGFVSASYLRFNDAGQVFTAYSSDGAQRVAEWIGLPGLDYEATANGYSKGLYSVDKRKIAITFELGSKSKGTINRAGTALDLETWLTTTARSPVKESYKFSPKRGV